MPVKPIRDAVLALFAASWSHPTYPLIESGGENTDGESTEPPIDRPWVKFQTEYSFNRQRWMGSPRGFSEIGAFQFTVFVPRDLQWDDGDLDELADEIADAFVGVTLPGGISFEPEDESGVRRSAPFDDPDGPYRGIAIDVPFQHEFTKA